MFRGSRARRVVCVFACLGFLASSGCKTTSGAEFETNCQLAVSPDRQAIAYLTDTAVLRKKGDQEVRLAFAEHACLKKGKTTDKLALSMDGKFALVLGGESRGFNLHESVPFEVTVCCLVDFDLREVKDLIGLVPDAGLDRQIPHRKLLMSPRRQVGFSWGATDREVGAIDLAAGKSALLDLPASDGCDLVEVDQRALMACPGFTQAPDGGYEHFVQVNSIDMKQWPPVVLEPRQIPVGAGINGVALSRDGQLLAYWGYTFGKFGDYHDLFGVLELASGKRRFEHRETRYGFVTAAEFSPDGKSLLVGESLRDGGKKGEKIGTNERGQVSQLDLSGKRLASRDLKDSPRWIYWMNDGILCDLGCRAVKLAAF